MRHLSEAFGLASGGLSMSSVRTAQLVVIGGGPGGYAAAFAAADHGIQVVLVSDEPTLGGVCLNRGCIPSKALLHVAKVIREAERASAWGVEFAKPVIDLAKLRAHKESVVAKMTQGLAFLAQQRGVELLEGRARFAGGQEIAVDRPGGETLHLKFEHAIIATGSRPLPVPGLPASPRVMDSTAALALEEIPERLLVIGGGYIGLELATVYSALGSQVTVVEMQSGLLPGFDRDLVRPLSARLKRELHQVMLETRVAGVEDAGDHLRVRFEGKDAPQGEQRFDRVLVSVGRVPNTAGLGLENTRVRLDARGFIEVDTERRSAEPTIFAIGDVAGPPMLAHKASFEGKRVAELIAGKPAAAWPRVIPSVVYTDPELAACGVSEEQAKAEGRAVKVLRFPWGASGRATASGSADGLTKLIVDAESEAVIGAGIVGSGASELIAEAALAIEMGATAEDVGLTIHPHPTLSESVMEAAESLYGLATHIYRRS